MRVLIFGMNGQLGKALRKSFANQGVQFVAVGSEVCDLTKEDQIQRILHVVQPNFVINAAAYTNVAKAEEEEELAFLVNSKAPEILAKECAKIGAYFIHISTDYVFDGESEHPYTESDKPNPLSVYGSSKLEGERAVQTYGHHYLIIRVSWLYDFQSPNFVTTMRRIMQEKQYVEVVDDQVASPTSAQVFANNLVQIVLSIDQNQPPVGIYHYAHSGSCSWFDFARYINSVFGLNSQVIPVSSAQFNDGVKRPTYSKLNTQRIYEQFPIQEVSWENAFMKSLKLHEVNEGTGC